MEPIKTLRSRTVVLPATNIDTDQIIPARFLTTTTREGLGKSLFADWRYDAAGAPKQDFVLNRPEARGCQILVAGRNLGCGSSREHAPWGLQDYGFQAIVAPSFADIFYSNCTKIGLLPIVLDEEHCQALARAGEGQVDLQAQEVRYAGPDGERVSVGFEIDRETRRRLLAGLDDIGVTLGSAGEIEAFEATRERSGPVTTAL
jgi:3-isopropylmalate/(R)-2-methylmalate dehydratase small subunit